MTTSRSGHSPRLAHITPHPQNPCLQTNTWYTLSVVVDDGAGFYIEACQVDNPAVRGSYHTWMPTGKSWRFHHWIWTGNAYIDEYREFTTSGLDWSPKQWLAYTYDGLDRLTGVAPVGVWQGYTAAYTYSVIGNPTSKTEDGSAWAYTYPSSGAGSSSTCPAALTAQAGRSPGACSPASDKRESRRKCERLSS
jgi:hypothetical protein